MAKAKHQLVQRFSRPGEGVVVGTIREKLPGGVGIALDFTSVPAPERRFAADAAWVEIGADMVRVLFAQFRGAGPDIEHIVVLRLPFQAARMFLRSMHDSVAPNATAYLSKWNVPPSPAVEKNCRPSQTFTLDANIIISGFSGREAVFDLYHSSPHAKVALLRGSDLYAEPVARVVVTTRLMMDIYDYLVSRKEGLPADEEESHE